MPLDQKKTDRQLLDGLRNGEASAAEELICRYSERVSRFLHHKAIPEPDEAVLHRDIMAAIIDCIRRHELLDGEALNGFVRRIARRRMQAYRGRTAAAVTIARTVLTGLAEGDREILVRLYLREQTPGQICAKMQISPEQLRRLQSRARRTFWELGHINPANAPEIPLRAETKRCVP